MRILLVANTLPPRDISGAGEQVLQLAAGLRAAGHEVEVLGRGPGGAQGPKVFFPLTILPAAFRRLHRFRPDVVQVHESDAALVALLVKLARPWLRLFFKLRPRLWALLQVSYIEEMRAVRPLRHAGRVLGRPGGVEKRFLFAKGPLQVALGFLTAQLADKVLACSQKTAEEVERDYRVRGVKVLPNVTGGRDVETAPPRDGDPAAGYLLYVGRLRIRKGVEVLLEALPALLEMHRSTRLVIAGDGEQRAALEAKVRELDLGESVLFLGRCDAPRVRRLLLGARALVVPSTYEGMPLVILEAMEAGVPVVASTVSGIPEVVRDSDTGWLVPPEDPPCLREALDALLTDPDEGRRRGEAGRRRVAEKYTPARAAEIWLGLLSKA